MIARLLSDSIISKGTLECSATFSIGISNSTENL